MNNEAQPGAGPGVPGDPPSGVAGANKRQPLATHWRILIGLVCGLIVGLTLNVAGPAIERAAGEALVLRVVVDFVVRLNTFIGEVFLRGLRFIAVPIVLCSLVVGAASLNDLKKLSRIGGRTIVIYLFTTSLAITIGLLLGNLFRPGAFVPQAARDLLVGDGLDAAAKKIESAAAPDMWQTLLEVLPTNPFAALAEGNMLQVVAAALAVGISLTLIPEQKAKPVIALFDALNLVVIKLVQVIMLLAPVAVFSLMAGVTATLGFDVLGALLVYSLVVVGGLALMVFGVYAAGVRFVAGVGLRRFFKAIAPAQLLAFSSSSSSATLPVTMDCLHNRLGASDEVTSFVLPLGATINMDGTALYQGVAAIFIAQVYGIDLSFSQQLTIVLTATLASIGTAGVPGVGIVMLVIVLQSVGMPPDVMAGGIAMIFGVDRLLDMCRTVTNVTGDAMVTAVIAAREGELLDADEVEAALARRRSAGVDEQP
jgi:proton glutamate symport protein